MKVTNLVDSLVLTRKLTLKNLVRVLKNATANKNEDYSSFINIAHDLIIDRSQFSDSEKANKFRFFNDVNELKQYDSRIIGA